MALVIGAMARDGKRAVDDVSFAIGIFKRGWRDFPTWRTRAN
jgi:hypothetical protein